MTILNGATDARKGTPNKPTKRSGPHDRLNARGPLYQTDPHAETDVQLLYDGRRYLRHAYLFSAQTRDHLQAQVLADAHFLEYGMALRRAQPGFGRERALRLTQGLRALSQDGTGSSTETYAAGPAVLPAFLGFNSAMLKGLEPVHAIAATLPNPGTNHISAGTKSITRDAIQTTSNIEFPGFV